MRTRYPPVYTEGTLRLRPGFYTYVDKLDQTDILARHFPGLQPRTAFSRGDSSVYGLSFGEYVLQLFNLEGHLLRNEPLSREEITAGLALALQDHLDLVWFPKTDIFFLQPDSYKQAANRCFLVIPVQLDDGDWILAIVDRNESRILVFDSSPFHDTKGRLDALNTVLMRMKLTSSNQSIDRATVTPQYSTWESGLFVLECARCYFREPDTRMDSLVQDWASSKQYHRSVPVLGTLETTKKKVAWMITVWIAWIRAELGHRDFSPLRVPEEPLRGAEGTNKFTTRVQRYRGSIGSVFQYATIPNSMKMDTQPQKSIDARLKDDFNPDDVPDHRTDEEKFPCRRSHNQVTTAFDTWISGEAGRLFTNWLPEGVTSYEYTVFRGAPALPPLRYAKPMVLERQQEFLPYSDDEEVDDVSLCSSLSKSTLYTPEESVDMCE